jgi:hypothetical protein
MAGVTAQAAETTTAMKPFTALSSDLPAQFELVVGDKHSVQIDAEPHVVKKIGMTVKGGVLTIGATGEFQTEKAILVRVSTPSLSAITMGGAAEFSAENIPSQRLTLVGKDSASITIEKLNVEQISSDLAGSSTASLVGNAGSQQIRVHESATFEARALQSKSATVEVSGAGDAVLNVANELQVTVSDAGSVSYQGSPKLKKSVQDAGSIEKI